MARREAHTPSTRGFTLVELMIASTIGAILLAVTVRAWGPMSQATFELRDRAVRAAELQLAVEWLLEDLGVADTALVDIDGGLIITREQSWAELVGAWSGGDLGIVWSLDDGDLLREDLALVATLGTGASVIVARGIESFLVTRPGDLETRIELTVGTGDDERRVELVWPE